MPEIHSIISMISSQISKSPYPIMHLDECQLGGSNVESVNIGSQASVSLLGTVGAKTKC